MYDNDDVGYKYWEGEWEWVSGLDAAKSNLNLELKSVDRKAASHVQRN